MQKNNLKNFVCSFIFSVLAVWAVQKVILRTPNTAKTQPKPEPQIKNISLFEEDRDDTPLINISNLAQNTSKVDVSQIALLSTPQKAENTEKEDIFEFENKEEHKEKPAVSTDINEASEIMLSDAEISETRQIKKHIESGIVYADISDTLDEAKNSPQDEEEIPLFATNEPVYNKIEVSTNAKSSEIAMVEPNTLINSMQEPDILAEEKNLAEADIKKNELGEMFDVSENEDNPWLMAKGNKYAKNQAVVEQFSNKTEEKEADVKEDLDEQSEKLSSEALEVTDDQELLAQTFSEPLLKEKPSDTKLAYQMIQNILIPIPQDILNDGNLTPDLTSSPEEKEAADKQNIGQQKEKGTKNISQKDEQTGLFKSISSWFSKNAEETNDKDASQSTKSDKKDKDQQGSVSGVATIAADKKSSDSVFDSVQNYEYRAPSYESIVPAELRLSFQPNKAEISGQTLKWIYAFADNARDNDDVFIEIRIDGTSSCVLQQKRLNLLSTILRARGVDYRKINTIFTSREPNSFIIRNIRFNKKEENKKRYGQ